MVTQTVNVPETYEVNFERIVAAVKDRGIFAYTEHTGGGCATIYAGPQHTDPQDGEQYWAVAVGAGYFEGGSLQGDGIGDTRDLVVGFDGEYDQFEQVQPGTTEGEIVDMIEAWVAKAIVRWP